jgi:hypothetical protein
MLRFQSPTDNKVDEIVGDGERERHPRRADDWKSSQQLTKGKQRRVVYDDT